MSDIMSDPNFILGFSKGRELGEKETKEEIRRLLQMDFDDLQECKGDQMDIELGEICRDKLNRIYRILARECGMDFASNKNNY